ncbi:hypothetical protein CAOG_01659 [Capsaspora owczarzaki ATCC 30864]|uniref:Uncharacterized protein n=1 Tax=Capsaspora owczarzaki (strain ATCC 30864) TaxID=595528 RepID=A0A0D2WKV2_CAPO3|nr:hypothetical protein CAOG_01659 [Capsaspora owczarzaki ATCC 30864]KJE90333.1 hypothetical protein CAOG_001659 [Capsaspora owczarzaki ATCC 30864]|eukprot:XP_004364527.1 hypothetical protein CAOG_01659 [Capsaspora owczarzaki ATCC 30864]
MASSNLAPEMADLEARRRLHASTLLGDLTTLVHLAAGARGLLLGTRLGPSSTRPRGPALPSTATASAAECQSPPHHHRSHPTDVRWPSLIAHYVRRLRFPRDGA